MSEQKITGIDLATTNFYLFSINAHGKPAGKIKLSRKQLLNWLALTKIHDEDVRRPTEMTQKALRRIAESYAIEAEIRGSPACVQESQKRPVDTVVVRLDTVAEENAVETCGDSGGVRLYPEAMGCAERVLSWRRGGNRQQHRWKRAAIGGGLKKILSLLRFRQRWRKRGDYLQPAGHLQTERSGGHQTVCMNCYPGTSQL